MAARYMSPYDFHVVEDFSYGILNNTVPIAGIVNSSGHFYSSSAAELTKIYQTSASNAANYTAAATGHCGPQAAFAVTTRWSPCVGVDSPKNLASQ